MVVLNLLSTALAWVARSYDLVPLAALMVAGASGAVTGLKTVQCFTSAEFLEAQNAAGANAMKYAAPS